MRYGFDDAWQLFQSMLLKAQTPIPGMRVIELARASVEVVRDADEISFDPAHCLQLLEDKLKQSQIATPSMQDPTIYQELLEPIAEMSKIPSWGTRGMFRRWRRA